MLTETCQCSSNRALFRQRFNVAEPTQEFGQLFRRDESNLFTIGNQHGVIPVAVLNLVDLHQGQTDAVDTSFSCRFRQS